MYGIAIQKVNQKVNKHKMSITWISLTLKLAAKGGGGGSYVIMYVWLNSSIARIDSEYMT